MSSAYREVRKELAQQAAEDLRCRWCGQTAAASTLSAFGARCGGCYAEYCRAVPRGPEIPHDAKGADGPHAWAYRLRARADAGERLSHAQQWCLSEYERRHGAARSEP